MCFIFRRHVRGTGQHRALNSDFNCQIAKRNRPGVCCGAGRRPSLSSPRTGRGMERHEALPFSHRLAARTPFCGSARLAALHRGICRSRAALSRAGVGRSDQPAPGRRTVVFTGRSPGAPECPADQPNPQEPHPAPPIRVTGLTPSDEQGTAKIRPVQRPGISFYSQENSTTKQLTGGRASARATGF